MSKNYNDIEYQFGASSGSFERFKNRKKADKKDKSKDNWLRNKRKEKQNKRWE